MASGGLLWVRFVDLDLLTNAFDSQSLSFSAFVFCFLSLDGD